MNTRDLTRPGTAMTVLASVLVLAACAGKINQENYGKVDVGMTQAQVEAILGPGTEQASTAVAMPAMPTMPAVPGAPATTPVPAKNVTTKVLIWRSGGRMISVTMLDDKVFAKTQIGL